MASADEILAVARDGAHRRTKTVRILLHQGMVAEHARLVAARDAAVAASGDEIGRSELARSLTDDVAAYEVEMDAACVEFRLRSMGRRDWLTLLAAHPPTKEQVAEARKAERQAPEFDTDSFPSAAIAASMVDPEMSVEQVAELADVLTVQQFNLLWSAVLDVNVGGGDLPKDMLGGVIRRLSDGSGKQPTTTGSPVPSSSDGS